MSEPRHLIFVNYRGSDEIWAAEYVHTRMVQAFGADAVFKAGNSLRAGDVYPPILREKAARCPVMLVCMGKAWLTASDADGARRLDSPDDWVREEISLALRSGRRVVPLLIGNHGEVSVPDGEQLPPDIRDLIGHQARRLVPGGGLDLTMPALVEELAALVPELGQLRAARQKQAPDAAAPAESGPDRQQSGVVFHIKRVEGDAVGHKIENHYGQRPDGSS